MKNFKFKLKNAQVNKTPSKQKETLISLIFSYGYFEIDKLGNKKYIPLRYSTGLKILPKFWNTKTNRAKQTSNFDYKSFNMVLDDLEILVKQIYRKNQNISPYQLKIEINNKLNKNQKEDRVMTLNNYIEKFIFDIENGIKKNNNGENYKKGTIKTYKNFKVTFDKFQKFKNKKYNFNDINLTFYNDYINYLGSNNSNPNTVGKHIKSLKSIMNDAKEKKLHNNTEINNKAFKVIKLKVDNIYLSEEEINKLYRLDLSQKKHLEIARDVFLVGCYTAQRYSDYSKINENSIRTYNGIKYIELIQQKTNEKVIIPIRAELNHILNKYKGNLPKTYDQKINKYIKEIGKLAGINANISVIEYKNGNRVKKIIEKYKLITTHTARRSGATNMYLAGIPTIDIMKITGHVSESSFLTYIKVSKQETAINLSNHPYFK